MKRSRVLKSCLLCACDRLRSVDGHGLNLDVFGEKGPDPVGKEGLHFKCFALECFLNVFKLWPTKRLAWASLHSTN